MPTFALIHSPLVGPVTWMPVAEVLHRHGAAALVPDLDGVEGAGVPYWQQHAHAVARSIQALPAGDQPVLVGHSGAGPLLPAIRAAAGRSVAGYLFVDAGLPQAGPRLGDGEFAHYLRQLYARGDRFPNWTDEALRAAIPDPAVRRQVLGAIRPQPFAFWEETLPAVAGWPDAPCAYLRFAPNPAYDVAVAEARRRGWAYAEMAGNHFHSLVDPPAVATALLDLCRRAGIAAV